MSGGAKEKRRRDAEIVNRQAAKHRKYRIAAVAAAVLVVILALFLFNNSEETRYGQYRQQAAESYQNGDYDQALSALRKAVAIQPSEECLMLMADCYEAQENWELALETLRRMDRNDPSVKSRIDALEQRRQQQQAEGMRMVAGVNYAAAATELNLDGQELGDGVLQELRQLHALTRLSLADNRLQDLTPLEDLGGLTALNLEGNEIRDLTALGKLSNLRSLSLDRNPVEDFSPLYSLSELNTLSLCGIELDSETLEELSSHLPRCAILTDGTRADQQNICLSGVRFNTGATQLDLSGLGLREIWCLSLCTELRVLNLSDNEISDLSPLMNLQSLEQLRLDGNAVADLRPLMGIPALRRLSAARNNVTETNSVGSITGLTELDLSDNAIQDFSGLKKLQNIQILRLENTGIGDETLAIFYELGSLTRLALDRNDGLTADTVNGLKKELPRCSISHGDLVYIVELGGLSFRTDVDSLSIEGTELSDLFGLEKFTCLETLELGRNRIENISVLRDSQSRECLRSLNLSYNQISDLSPLSAMSALETLDLSGNRIESLRPLMQMTQLRHLRLTGNPLTEEQVYALRQALPECEIEF